jgi:hypothetical protein
VARRDKGSGRRDQAEKSMNTKTGEIRTFANVNEARRAGFDRMLSVPEAMELEPLDPEERKRRVLAMDGKAAGLEAAGGLTPLGKRQRFKARARASR